MTHDPTLLNDRIETRALSALLEAIALELDRMTAACRACERDLAPLIAGASIGTVIGLQALERSVRSPPVFAGCWPTQAPSIEAIGVHLNAMLLVHEQPHQSEALLAGLRRVTDAETAFRDLGEVSA